MAKTLVALYDTVPDAERVVQELMADGFARSDIHLALNDTQSRATQRSTVEGDTAYAGALVVVESGDDQAERGMAILQRLHPVNMHERTAQWRQAGWTSADAPARTASPPASAATTTRSTQEPARAETRGADQGATTRRVEGQEEVTIPVVEEDLAISKREVERGHVRIYSRVTEQPVEEAVRLREERVTVERRPVDRPATEADLAAQQEVIEVTETAEEPVVTRRARVVEEVVVQKEATERTETVRGTERHTEVEVQRAPEDATTARRAAASQGFEAYDATFRAHYTTAFATGGAAYTAYEPAYRYGYELGTNERYRGRDWAALEADARRDWEARHPETWTRFHEAIRHAWEAVRGRR
jgi:uncharacterized protein (TIGR02271 family)